MIAVVDYGAGNLFSLKNACDHINMDAALTRDADELARANGIIIPGVGAFPDAMEKLSETGLIPEIKRQAALGKPILGICLGMQILFDYGLEFKKTEGLGLIPGYVEKLDPKGLKLPHIGWNSLDIKDSGGLFRGVPNGGYVYFVHSYAAMCDERYVSAFSEYGSRFPAAVKNQNVMGSQFHPEKSSGHGLLMLKNFKELVYKK